MEQFDSMAVKAINAITKKMRKDGHVVQTQSTISRYACTVQGSTADHICALALLCFRSQILRSSLHSQYSKLPVLCFDSVQKNSTCSQGRTVFSDYILFADSSTMFVSNVGTDVQCKIYKKLQNFMSPKADPRNYGYVELDRCTDDALCSLRNSYKIMVSDMYKPAVSMPMKLSNAASCFFAGGDPNGDDSTDKPVYHLVLRKGKRYIRCVENASNSVIEVRKDKLSSLYDSRYFLGMPGIRQRLLSVVQEEAPNYTKLFEIKLRGNTLKEVKDMIKDYNDSRGCSCEYDCCGHECGYMYLVGKTGNNRYMVRDYIKFNY